MCFNVFQNGGYPRFKYKHFRQFIQHAGMLKNHKESNMTIEIKFKTRRVVKKRYKTYNPVTFAVPKELKDKIRRVFELTIAAIKTNTGTVTDWYNVAFRTKHALEIAKVVYTDETVKEFQTIFDMLVLKASEHESNLNWFRFNENEVALVEDMHEAMCVMEDDVTRRIQLETIHITDRYMKQFINKS
jgi:hypothetical protein